MRRWCGFCGPASAIPIWISQGLLSVPRRDRLEYVGVVEEGSAGLVGERVVGEINLACGACTACRSCPGDALPDPHRTGHCRAGRCVCRRFGAAGRKSAPGAERDRHGCGDLCRTLGCGARHSAASDDSSHDRVFLHGDGKLGQLIAQTLALTGCELLLVGRRPQKLALLSGRGITTGTAEDVYAGASYVAV